MGSIKDNITSFTKRISTSCIMTNPNFDISFWGKNFWWDVIYCQNLENGPHNAIIEIITLSHQANGWVSESFDFLIDE